MARTSSNIKTLKINSSTKKRHTNPGTVTTKSDLQLVLLTYRKCSSSGTLVALPLLSNRTHFVRPVQVAISK